MRSAMPHVVRSLLTAGLASGLLVTAACHTTGTADASKRPSAHRRHEKPIQRVLSLFDQRPWLNLDVAGDRDPEGVHYRVFLDDGSGKGVHRDGSFEVEMYELRRQEDGLAARTLISDWKMPTSGVQGVKSRLLGMGYHIQLRWASKATAGREVELVTRYRAPDGRVLQAATKQLRVPKYTS